MSIRGTSAPAHATGSSERSSGYGESEGDCDPLRRATVSRQHGFDMALPTEVLSTGAMNGGVQVRAERCRNHLKRAHRSLSE